MNKYKWSATGNLKGKAGKTIEDSGELESLSWVSGMRKVVKHLLHKFGDFSSVKIDLEEKV